MGLDFAEPFARRVEGHRHVVDQRLEVGKPPFGVTHLIGDDHHEPLRHGAREGSHEDGIGGAGEAPNTKRPTRTGEGLEHAIERLEAGDRVEQTWESHLSFWF